MAGISQLRLGALLGVTKQTVAKWENGAAQPSAGKIADIATALGVSPSGIFDHTFDQIFFGEQ